MRKHIATWLHGYMAKNQPIPVEQYNNETMKQLEKGQALLIVIMVLATALTVVLATTFTSRTDTQITRLEADSQKALAAAEAGIEVALSQGIDDKGSLPISGISGFESFGGSADVGLDCTSPADCTSKPFTTPLLRKDEQYTYYLAPYNKATGINLGVDPSPPNSTINFCFGQLGGSARPALEFTFISKSAPHTLVREVFDSNTGSGKITNAQSATLAAPNEIICGGAGHKFAYRGSLSYPPTPPAVLFVRVLRAPSKILLKQTNRKPQGTVIKSNARGSTGTEKIVQLFQSYPQIPADFFVTQL